LIVDRDRAAIDRERPRPLIVVVALERKGDLSPFAFEDDLGHLIGAPGVENLVSAALGFIGRDPAAVPDDNRHQDQRKSDEGEIEPMTPQPLEGMRPLFHASSFTRLRPSVLRLLRWMPSPISRVPSGKRTITL
jgi:hypothetical protein